MESKEQVVEACVKYRKVMSLSSTVYQLFFIWRHYGQLGSEATSFIRIGQATWNPDHRKMAEIISRQARAIGVTQAFAPVLIYPGLMMAVRMKAMARSNIISAMGTVYVKNLERWN